MELIGKPEEKPEAQDARQEKLPLVVEILPGVAKRGYLLPLGNDGYGSQIEKILRRAVESRAPNRELESIQGVLKTEYTGNARVLIGDSPVDMRDTLDKYERHIVPKETSAGTRYNLLQIRVAKPQEGGLFY